MKLYYWRKTMARALLFYFALPTVKSARHSKAMSKTITKTSSEVTWSSLPGDTHEVPSIWAQWRIKDDYFQVFGENVCMYKQQV